MSQRAGVLLALLVAAAVTVMATVGVTATPLPGPTPAPRLLAPQPAALDAPASRGNSVGRSGVLGGTRAGDPPPADSAPPVAQERVHGLASNYPGTAGWLGAATAALPGALRGAYTGAVNGHVTVCADRCAYLPVVDWCECYWGTAGHRIVDLSHAAWGLVSDRPLQEGLITVTLILEPPDARSAIVRSSRR